MTPSDPNTTRPETYDLFEELQVAGEQLLGKVKSLLHEGSVRNIRIKQGDRVLIEVPLALGFAGVVLAPTLAAIGTMGALLAQCTIEVVRSPRANSAASSQYQEATHVAEEPFQES